MKLRNQATRRGRRAFIAIAAVTVAGIALSGCGAGGTGTSATDGAGLTVVVEGGGKAELQPIADLYKEETGTEVTLVELPYAGLYDRISSELQAGKPSFDIAALDAIWLPAFAPGLAPLDDLFTDDVESDLFGGLVSESKVDDTFVGMPVWTNSEILFYRTDLFEDPANMAAFEAEYGYPLAAPTTWEQYQDVAEFFTQDTDGDGAIDLYGTDVKGAVETEWLATVSQAGEENMVLNADSGEVTIDDAAHKEALDYYVSLLPFAPSGAAQLDWAGAQNLFYQGKLAMMRFWGHAYRQTPDDSPVKEDIGVAPMIGGPGGVAGVPGAWYLSVPASGDNQDAAKDFISFAYEHNDLAADTSLGLVARKSAFESKEGEAGFENYPALVTTLEAPQSLPRPATPQWQEIVDSVLVPMIQKAVEPGADTAQLLSDAQSQIESIVQ
ncbi:ABC-type glycerol-3-phosphate transport system substrate-binding protein [Microbacterium sp. BE35]|uniref:ABC transporter substrate-binding protein n=1 Tax=Microbacterium sp. BE35 TaxID=2817773 RepID=UPI00286297D9|nr:extracellular solute-binding protein [Microbacterium sp. BE35]MDR7187434.1 ABC-type glycerol-3-phosphate transport system substrate-binding protein [Microbacterium sp. BE35]